MSADRIEYTCASCGKLLDHYEDHTFYDSYLRVKAKLNMLTEAVLNYEKERGYESTYETMIDLAKELFEEARG